MAKVDRRVASEELLFLERLERDLQIDAPCGKGRRSPSRQRCRSTSPSNELGSEVPATHGLAALLAKF